MFMRSVEMCFHSFPKDEDLRAPVLKEPIAPPSKKMAGLKKTIRQISHAKAITVKKDHSFQDMKENDIEKSLNEKQMSKIRWVANQSEIISDQKEE